eukprot:745645_1
MEIDSSASKKRSREDSSKAEDTSPPSKKQKIDVKESTPPLAMDEDDKKTKPISADKPPLIPTPSSGNIEKRTRERKPGLAKVPSNLLEFNGLIAAKPLIEIEKKDDKKKVSDKEEADDTKSEEKDVNSIDIDRQKLISEIKGLLAPCSRELISKGKIVCVIWFDQDDDGNTCLWIAKKK